MNSNSQSLAAKLVGAVMERWSPKRRAEKAAPGVAAEHIKRQQEEVAQRSASIPPPTVGDTGKSWSGREVAKAISEEQQARLGSEDARRGRAFARTGPSPRWSAQYPRFDLNLIATVHTHVERNGYMWDKADLDARILREHEALHPADRARRMWLFATYPRLVPANDSRVALLVRHAVAAVIDQIDGFDSSVGELQIANASGLSMGELIWRDRRLRIPVGPGVAVSVDSETISSIESVPLRSIATDIDTEIPYVNQGGWGWVNPFVDPWRQEPLRKVIYHKTYGDGDARMRGYGFCAHHLHWLSKLAWEKKASLLEVYGLQSAYVQPQDDNENIRDEDYEAAETFISRLGKGFGGILSARLGKVELTPPPGQLTPIHQAIMGYCNTAMLRLVTGQTLSQEAGDAGSYNLGETHADQQEGGQRIDCRMTCNTLNAQLIRYIVQVNAQRWAAAFAPHSEGESCTPEDILASAPRINWHVGRKETRTERLKMFIDASPFLDIDSDQVRDECDLRAPIDARMRFAQKAAEQPQPQQPAAAAPKPEPAPQATDGAKPAQPEAQQPDPTK